MHPEVARERRAGKLIHEKQCSTKVKQSFSPVLYFAEIQRNKPVFQDGPERFIKLLSTVSAGFSLINLVGLYVLTVYFCCPLWKI